MGLSEVHSWRKLGRPDGLFGQETHDAIHAFQGRKGLNLKQNGVAGKNTIGALDNAMVTLAGPVLPKPSPALPPPMTAQYQLGASDPPFAHDPGADLWNSRAKTVSQIAPKAAILRMFPQAHVAIGDDAAKHMAHDLGNSENRFTIDLEGMVRDVPSVRARYEDKVDQARVFVEKLSAGRREIASQVAEGGYHLKGENWNWYFTIGGYSRWGRGVATVADKPGGRQYTLDFTYKLFDRYNGDAGKSVTVFNVTITDEFMGEFHRQKLAKKFGCVGSFQRRLTWRRGQVIPKDQLDHPVGGR
ncbi:peptidoglycan-binding protein [Myxococcota bacterium]